MSVGLPNPAPSTQDESPSAYLTVFAIFDILVFLIAFGFEYRLGYDVNFTNLILLMILINLIAFPAYVMVKKAESGRGHWGGFVETWGILAFGSMFLLIGIALVPPEMQRMIQRNLSPYEVVEKPVDNDPPRPEIRFATDKSVPKGTERVYVEIPKVDKNGKAIVDVQTVTVLVKVKADQAQDKAKGILVEKDRQALRVWYNTKDQSSFADDSK